MFRPRLVVALCALALSATACGATGGSPTSSAVTSSAGASSPASPTGSAAAPIKVGGLWPLSGDNAAIGNGQKAAFQFAIDKIDAAGGIKSLGGRPLQAVYGDTAGKPETGASETQRLIQQEGVVAVVGAYQSSVTLPSSAKAQSLSTPFIDDIAVSDKITDRGYDFVFRAGPKNAWYARDMVDFLDYLGQQMGKPVTRVALLHEDTDFGTGAAQAQTQLVQAKGMQIVADVSYTAAGAADLTTQVNKVKAASPDVVLTTTYLTDSILIVRARVQLGMANIPFIDQAGGTIDPQFISQLGNDADGIFSLVEFSPLAAGPGQKMNADFKAVSGTDFSGNSAWAYNAAIALAAGLEKAGSDDRAKLKAALQGLTVTQDQGLIGPAKTLHFGPDGQNDQARVFVIQIQNQQLVPVWPAEFAGAKIQLGG